jgi:hypothetical protein
LTLNIRNGTENISTNNNRKKGIVAKISGKKEKTKIKIAFEDGHDETWGICSIKNNSLKNLNKENEVESEE